MNNRVLITIIGILFTSITGCLSHFLYDWTGSSIAAALISPVNESTWEHLKLLFFPYLLYAVFECFYLKRRSDASPASYLTAKTAGILSGLVTIPVVFYLYTSILGTHALWLDILTFELGVIVSFAVDFLLLKKQWVFPTAFCILILLLLITAFILFTFYPPTLDFFLDPVTGKYGLKLTLAH